ncbi:hypothetical protein F4781DRAFT_441815 [Annulohypoxylon bovei var. microspora]|nr:hypothetical protein F4781DRAFT_441815 [Annulohypoxylon bovei var. microspora]
MCAPLSRRDQATQFCRTNLQAPELRAERDVKGPFKGLKACFEKLDSLDRDEPVDFISPSKYYAWNFQPSKEGRSGSIEFRRPPAVDTTKKAKHWVAFTMAFVWMAVTSGTDSFVHAASKTGTSFAELRYPNFEERLVQAAKEIGVFWYLDARLRQVDRRGDASK